MVSSAALQLRFDAFELDEADARLKRDGKPVALAPKAFGVLCALARQPGTLVTKNALLDAVWGHQHVSESVLKTTISQLRAALADDASSPRYIETASRLGYRFIAKLGAVPVAAVAVGSPAVAEESGTVPMIGRRAPLSRLNEAWRRAGAGQRQLVWVAGDAGVGKTTLIDAFTRGSGAAAIAQGQCVEQFGSGEPYLPVLQALGDLCREYPELPTLMRTVAPTWLLQLPWLATEQERALLTRELVGVNQERMLREFHELAARFSEKQPLLFVIEDLHWGDPATLRLMDHFARQRGAARVMWLSTFRLTQVIAEGHPLQALRQELRMHRLCDEIVLDPFSESEVLEYLRGRLALAEAPEAFVRRVHVHTDGLPLFVANVVDALFGPESDTDSTGDRRATFAANTPLPVPEDLKGAVETRIAKLSDESIALLEAAAVCGVEFRAGAVAEMLGRPLDAVIEEFDRLVKRQYWLRHTATVDLSDGTLDAQYAFRHAIYRHVFYHRLGDTPRLQLHRRAAQALAAGVARGLPVAPAELASHHERGREFAAALRAYVQAAQSALRTFDPRQAGEICERARALLDCVPVSPEKPVLELAVESTRGIAAAQVQGIGAPEPRAIYERVRELCRSLPQLPTHSLLLSGYAASLYARGEYAKLIEVADELDAIDGPDRQALSVMTCLLRAGSAAARGECRVSTEYWFKAIAACEQITDRRAFAPFIVDPETAVRANSVKTLFARGLADQARMQSLRALAMAEKFGPMAQSLANWRAGMLAVRLGDAEAAFTHGEAMERIVAQKCIVQGDGPSRYFRGWALAQQGEHAKGLELIRDGLERHLAIGMIAHCTEVMGYAVDALLLAREWDHAQRMLETAFVKARELDEQEYVPVLLIQQAQIAQGRGETDAAYRALQESVSMSRRQEARGVELRAASELAAHAGATAADRAALATLVAAFTEGHDTRDYRRAKAVLGS